jgi:hypothetical protein
VEKSVFAAAIIIFAFLIVTIVMLGYLFYRERGKRVVKVSTMSLDESGSRWSDVDGETIPISEVHEVIFRNADRAISDFRVAFCPPREEALKDSWERLEFTGHTQEWLLSVIGKASEFINVPLVASFSSTKTYKLVFDRAGDLMRVKGDGYRAMVLAKESHQIAGHGRLIPVGNVASHAALYWELVAAAVGRKYLVDIDKKLASLRADVVAIRQFLENERVAGLQADFKNLSDLAIAVRDNPAHLLRSSTRLVMLEQIERNASVVARSCLLDIQGFENSIKDIQLSATWEVNTTPLDRLVQSVTETLEIAAFALSVRVFCAELVGAHTEDSQMKALRLSDVTVLYAELNEKSKAVQLAIRNVVDRLSETFSLDETKRVKRERLRAAYKGRFETPARALKAARDSAETSMRAQETEKGLDKPVELAVAIDRSGQIVDARVRPMAHS